MVFRYRDVQTSKFDFLGFYIYLGFSLLIPPRYIKGERAHRKRSDRRKTHDESLPVVAGRMVGAPNDDEDDESRRLTDEAFEKLYGETAPSSRRGALGDIFFFAKRDPQRRKR